MLSKIDHNNIYIFHFPAPSFQVGKILANIKYANKDHRQFSWGPGKSDLGVGHHRLHFCGGRHAALWEELQRMCVQDF